MTLESINPLPTIRQFFEDHQNCQLGLTRNQLRDWISSKAGLAHLDPRRVELLIDCLIVVGAGRDSEQEDTVYCSATYN